MSTRLLLFLLFLSFHTHACNARHRSLFYKGFRKDSVVKLNYSNSTEIQGKILKTMIRGGVVNIGHVDASTTKPKELHLIPKIMDETRGLMTRRVVRIASQVAVSWKVPQKKHEKYPGFDSDYVPPRTHPPSHN